MTLKKINLKDLVKGQEYYVKLKLFETDESALPFGFKDLRGGESWYHKDQPIYTYEADQPIYTIEQTADTDLELLVNVASKFYATGELGNYDNCAKKAFDLITACKNALKEVNHD